MEADAPKQPPERGKLAAVRDFFALERNVAVLVGAVFTIGMGEELWTSFVNRYLRALGATERLVGYFGTLKALLDAVYQYPAGVISDHLGRRRSLVLFNLLAVVGYALYATANSPALMFVGVLFVMAWGTLSLPNPGSALSFPIGLPCVS